MTTIEYTLWAIHTEDVALVTPKINRLHGGIRGKAGKSRFNRVKTVEYAPHAQSQFSQRRGQQKRSPDVIRICRLKVISTALEGGWYSMLRARKHKVAWQSWLSVRKLLPDLVALGKRTMTRSHMYITLLYCRNYCLSTNEKSNPSRTHLLSSHWS